jgi:hypothetical protein
MSTIMHLARVPGKELPQEVPLKPIPVCPPPAVADLHDAHSHPGFTRRQHSVHVENPPVPCGAFVLQQIVHALLRSSERNRSSHLQPELDQAPDGFGAVNSNGTFKIKRGQPCVRLHDVAVAILR